MKTKQIILILLLVTTILAICYWVFLNNKYIESKGDINYYKSIDDAMSGNDNLAIGVLPANRIYKITEDYDAKHYMVYKVETKSGDGGWIVKGEYKIIKR